MEYIVIVLSAILVNNIVLAQFLGLCPFFGVSNKISTAAGMGGAVLFVMTVAAIVTYLISHYILIPAGSCLSADSHLHSGDFLARADGGDHP
jgi:Na+-translocating ferredoxin:NAD+ oxidoreductase subunit A